jgi:mannose-6-phosphate isomerase-like protein (cupin superfamily)
MDASVTEEDLQNFRNIQPEMIDLKIPLVSKGMTRDLKCQGDHSTFRIHCYGPNEGETHGLHAHVDEEHVFVILHGTAKFAGIDGDLPPLGKNQALWLPKGCFYEFVNPGPEPLVVLRFGATREKATSGPRVTPGGDPIPGRGTQHPEMRNPTYIEGAFLE